METSFYDYLYAIFGVLFGVFMIISPRTLMRGAKYDEESLKTESWVRKAGIGLIVISIGLAIYLFFK
ncbi:MAG: hypothetical protein E6767_14355 [Dysgonomonas sp.]|nr:hypothetical protein [Dysgonomonas sp.]